MNSTPTRELATGEAGQSIPRVPAWGLGLFIPLNALALVYFPELVCNAAAALSLGRRGRMFGLGLLLFVGCDVCVGLHNLAGLPAPLSAFAQVGMWLFYLPSQVLIVLSIPKE